MRKINRKQVERSNTKHKTARMLLCFCLIANLMLSLVPFEVYAHEKDEAQIERELKSQSDKFDEEKESLEQAAKEAEVEATEPKAEKEKADQEEPIDKDSEREKTEEKVVPSDSIEEDNPEPADLRQPEIPEEDAETAIDGELVEISEYSKTYKTDDGIYITRISAEPFLYTDNNEEIEIDNTLEEKAESFVNADNSYEINLPKEGDAVSIEDSGYVIEMKPLFGGLENAVTEENAIRYNEVSDGIDLQYTANSTYVKEDIILMHPQEKYSYEYLLIAKDSKVKSLEAKLEDGVVNIYDISNRKKDDDGECLVYTIDAPVMTDAKGEESYDVSLSLEEKEDDYILGVEADEKWLNSEDREYPVKIDPSVTMTLGQDNMEWHLVENGKSGGGILAGPNVNHKNVTYMYAGYEDGSLLGSSSARYGYTRSFLKIDYNFKQLC